MKMHRCESFSSMSCFERCPKQYKYKYIDKAEQKPPGEALVKGKLVHGLVEKRESGKHVEADYALTKTKKSVKKRRHKISSAQRTVYADIAKDKEGVKYLEGYEESFAIDAKLNIVEFDSDSAIFRGIVDYYVIELKKNPGEYQSFEQLFEKIKIYDWKTGKANFPRKQLNYYSVFFQALYPKVPISCCIVNTTVEEERFWESTPKTTEKALRGISECLNGIRKESQFLPNPMAYTCGWCDFSEVCPDSMDRRTENRVKIFGG